MQQSDYWLVTGISFGVNFPELMERMWQHDYEMVSQKSWTEARKVGVDLHEEATILRLEEMEQQVLVEVAAYVMEYYPELVNPLNLIQ